MYQNRLSQTVHALVFSGVCTMIAIPAIAQPPADNTKVNTRDRSKGAVTADHAHDADHADHAGGPTPPPEFDLSSLLHDAILVADESAAESGRLE